MDDFIKTCDCGGSFCFSVNDVARERTVKCSRGCSIRLQDEGGGAQSTSDALRDLDKALKDFGRRH
jgi:hypothetical protein